MESSDEVSTREEKEEMPEKQVKQRGKPGPKERVYVHIKNGDDFPLLGSDSCPGEMKELPVKTILDRMRILSTQDQRSCIARRGQDPIQNKSMTFPIDPYAKGVNHSLSSKVFVSLSASVQVFAEMLLHHMYTNSEWEKNEDGSDVTVFDDNIVGDAVTDITRHMNTMETRPFNPRALYMLTLESIGLLGKYHAVPEHQIIPFISQRKLYASDVIRKLNAAIKKRKASDISSLKWTSWVPDVKKPTHKRKYYC